MALRIQDTLQIEAIKQASKAQELTAMAQMSDEQRKKYISQRETAQKLKKYRTVLGVLWFFTCVLGITSILFPPFLLVVAVLVVLLVKTYKKYKPITAKYKMIYKG